MDRSWLRLAADSLCALFHFTRPTSHVPAAISRKAAVNRPVG